VWRDWVHLVYRSLLIDLLHQPRMIDDECEAVGGMRIGKGNRSTRRKPAPMPLCSPQIPHDPTYARTWTTAVGSRRLTARAMTRRLLMTMLECLSKLCQNDIVGSSIPSNRSCSWRHCHQNTSAKTKTKSVQKLSMYIWPGLLESFSYLTCDRVKEKGPEENNGSCFYWSLPKATNISHLPLSHL
jgi:hypothetical protein